MMLKEEKNMKNKLYISQISFSVTSDELADFVSSAGEVVDAKIITDRESGRSRGFGFVEMATDEAADNAVNALNGKELAGRAVNVAIAKPMEAKPRTGGFGGGGGGGGGNRPRRNF